MINWICNNIEAFTNILLSIVFGVLTFIMSKNANNISRCSNIIASNANKIMNISNKNYEVSFDGQKNYMLNELSRLGSILIEASSESIIDKQNIIVQKYVDGVMDERLRKKLISVGNNGSLLAHNKIKYYIEDRLYRANPDVELRDIETGVLNMLVLHFNLVNNIKNSYLGSVDDSTTNNRQEVKEIFNFYFPAHIRFNEEYMNMLEYSLDRFDI
ncbi:hypothetical protein [Anaerococcus sp. Marseille-Q5996]|uniref:hypothetical protein n=1 Tax=Anaerococcus sp. Marseille-Q5996 TaxID=2972769 RepID=UPI0021C5A070|nr:hypothetical protein [Anaerococcus sp. Marseille-Q5996]